jgi:hypothetical protein
MTCPPLVGRAHRAYLNSALGSGPLWRAGRRSRCRTPSLALAPTSATATGGSDFGFHLTFVCRTIHSRRRAWRASARGHRPHPDTGRLRGRSGVLRRGRARPHGHRRVRRPVLHHELPGRADGWEVGTTFSFIWPDRPVIYASAISAPPGPLRKGVFLRKPFLARMLAKAFEPARVAGTVRAGSAAHTKPRNSTAVRIKPACSFVHLS